MWEVEPSDNYKRRHRHYEKKHRRVLVALLSNLDTFFGALKSGAKIQGTHYGFMHDEPSGIKAIDQKGGDRNLAQGRLYVYPDEGTKILHLITICDKTSQQKDIQYCKKYVDRLREDAERRKREDQHSDAQETI